MKTSQQHLWSRYIPEREYSHSLSICIDRSGIQHGNHFRQSGMVDVPNREVEMEDFGMSFVS